MTTATSTTDGVEKAAASALRWIGLGLVLVAAMARGLTPFTNLPRWDLDPMQLAVPMTGIGPAGSLVFDVLALLGAGLAMLGEAMAGRRVLALPCALAGIGALAIVWHAWVHDGGSLGDLRIGAAWMGAIASGVAAMHLCREDRFRRLVLATFLGFVCVLALKGAAQVYIEHPQTVEDFRRNKAAILAAQGWTPDSATARAYERRLSQPEASGWYGLANVYASMGAASIGAGFGLVAARRRQGQRNEGAPPAAAVVLVWVGLAGGIGAVALSGAKGGVLATMVGVAAGLGVLVLARTAKAIRLPGFGARVAGGIGLAAVLLPIAPVLARGLVGERIGELSLLYRWFYMQAAIRIGGASPLLGVGPDGFQEAYLLAKNPLSVEDVKSPHGILLDWWATMGVFGFAWGALLLWWMWRAGRGAVEPETEAPATTSADVTRNTLRALGLIGAAATIAAAWLDRGLMTIDGALVRMIGLGLWCAAGWGVLRLGSESGWWLRVALFGGAVALAAHGQIDVVASWPASAGLFCVVIGASAAWGQEVGNLSRIRARAGPLAGAAMVGMAGAVLAGGAAPALRWERELGAAADAVSGLGTLERRLAGVHDAAASAERTEELRSIAREMARMTGQRVEPTEGALGEAIGRTVLRAIPVAVDRLMAADAIYPDEWRARREASRLCMVQSSILRSAGAVDEAARWADRAVYTAATFPEPVASELAWLATIHRARADMSRDPTDLRRAARVLEWSARLDPYNLESALRLMRLFRELGEAEKVVQWAKKALELDDLARLDRAVHGLRDSERTEARAAAGSS